MSNTTIKTQQNTQLPAGYKHTSVGLIPVDWEIPILNKVSEKIMVGIASAATHAYREKGIVMFRNQNIKVGLLDDTDILYIDEDYELSHKNKRLKGGDILIARTGYPGIACIVPEEYVGAQSFTTLIVRPIHKEIDKNFLCQYINSDKGQSFFESSQIGGGQKNVNAGTLETMPIPLPPLLEQKKIAEILSTWDNAIDNCKKIIKKLKKRNKGLAQQLLTGKTRVKGFEDTKWQYLAINKIAKEVSVKNIENKEMIVLSCTKHNGLVPSLEYFGRKIYSDDVSTYKIVKKGQFAYATNHIEEGSIGYQSRFEEALISPMYTVFETNHSINDELFFRLLKSYDYIHEYQRRMEGSIDRRGGLRWSEFSKIKVPLIDEKEQFEIEKILNNANVELKQYEQKLANLQLQKKGLMQQLLTGKVRVKLNK